METLYFLGIDIAKKTFDASLNQDGNTILEMKAENNSKAIKGFFLHLKKQINISRSQLIVCLEHTGIYCHPLLDYLVKAKIKVCVESPLQIKQSQGIQRGKNDKVDARRIAHYAYKNYKELRFWKPQRATIQKLKVLLTVRDRLVRAKAQFQTPLKESCEFIDSSLKKLIIMNCQKTLKALKDDILKVEREMDTLVREDQKLQQQVRWATSIPGVGKIIAINVIIATGELERISDAKKFACYAGVAPFEHSSGSSIRGKTRVSKMANMSIKTLLHLGARSSVQCSEEFKTYYQRKVAAGKNKMCVLNAVSNKLISRIFVCIKNQRVYEKIYQNTLA